MPSQSLLNQYVVRSLVPNIQSEVNSVSTMSFPLSDCCIYISSSVVNNHKCVWVKRGALWNGARRRFWASFKVNRELETRVSAVLNESIVQLPFCWHAPIHPKVLFFISACKGNEGHGRNGCMALFPSSASFPPYHHVGDIHYESPVRTPRLRANWNISWGNHSYRPMCCPSCWTPVVEREDLFSRGVGADSDIVSKEWFHGHFHE